MNNSLTDLANKYKTHFANFGTPLIVLFLTIIVFQIMLYIPNNSLPNFATAAYLILLVLTFFHAIMFLIKISKTSILKGLKDSLFLLGYYLVSVAPIITMMIIYFQNSDIIYGKYEIPSLFTINNFFVTFIIAQTFMTISFYTNVFKNLSGISTDGYEITNIDNRLSFAYQMILTLVNIFLAVIFMNNYKYFSVVPNN